MSNRHIRNGPGPARQQIDAIGNSVPHMGGTEVTNTAEEERERAHGSRAATLVQAGDLRGGVPVEELQAPLETPDGALCDLQSDDHEVVILDMGLLLLDPWGDVRPKYRNI